MKFMRFVFRILKVEKKYKEEELNQQNVDSTNKKCNIVRRHVQ